MRVGILHHDLEPEEARFQELLKSRGHEVQRHDIRESSSSDLEHYDVVLNRVYASVANRDPGSNIKTLQSLKELEDMGVLCVNSLGATQCDYSKYLSSLAMNQHDVPNPMTLHISRLDRGREVSDAVSQIGFPFVLKRDMGGRGNDIIKIEHEDNLEEILQDIHIKAQKEGYDNGFVIQEFLRNIRPYDVRIGVVDGALCSAYSRTLIPHGGNDCWFASVSSGSEMGDYIPSKEEIDLARSASKAIGAYYNEVDMIFTSYGPKIIENNSTPNGVKGINFESVVSSLEQNCSREE